MAATADWKRALDIPAPAELVRADWARRNSELEAALRDGPPPGCLRHPSVAFQMFVGEHHAVRELPYVTERLGGDRSLLSEPPAGDPPTMALDADLFVSTWALNESPPAAKALVAEREWFGASALLLVFHRGDPLEPAVLAAGAEALPFGPWMPGQHYFVR